MRQRLSRPRLLAMLGSLLALGVLACAPATSAVPSAASAPAPPATGSSAPTSGAQPASTAAAARDLPTTPVVDLKVGVLPIAAFGPFYIAQERGYFRELGLNVELVSGMTVNEHIAPLAQGQLHVAACASNVPCFNALNRQTDTQIVASLQSAGQTEKSTGNVALVVRKDLWDDGTIRGPQDLVGRTLYLQAGEGSAVHVEVATWLKHNGIAPRSVQVTNMFFPDVYAAMQNRGIEVGTSSEPLISMGLARGVHELLATMEEMHPTTQVLYLMYWSGIERLGPRVGERFMVAYLRAARDYINAFEYGIDQEPIIDILVRETPLKDPVLYRQIRYAWIDPDGRVNRQSMEADAELMRELGLLGPVDLSGMFVDKYREFAVQYLGPYRPPR
ncbi:MAG TPA: ABC transporter substrate-binding protein [Chloroflexota bacterium]|nr:ABC transporter substrate-binding protein [Chloroflexota bacterium]